MIFLIIGMIVFGIWFYLSTEEWLLAVFGIFAGLFVGTMVWIPVGVLINNHANTEQVLVKEEPIYALENISQTENDVYLWIGESRNHVNYKYVIDSKNGKHIEKINGLYDVYINEGDYEPKIEYYQCRYTNKLWNWVGLPPVFKDDYIFYVPEDTITADYSVERRE